MYHYIIIHAIMRDCDSVEDAENKCRELLPQHPDENTQYMESWEIMECHTVRVEDPEMYGE